MIRKTLFTLILFFSFNSFSKNNFQLSPSIKFNNDYIFTTEIYLDFKYNIKNDLNITGYVKKSNINGDVLFDIANNMLPIAPKGIETDNNNYFYQINISNKLYDKEDYKIFYTLSWYDSINYSESLKYTYADIYNYLKIKFNYLRNFNDQDYDFFISFGNTFNGFKNNINFGVNTKYKINDSNTIFIQYDYYKDIKKKDNVKLSHSHFIYPWVDSKYLLYEANNFTIIDTVDFDGLIRFDVLLKYSFVKNFGNNYYFGLSYYF